MERLRREAAEMASGGTDAGGAAARRDSAARAAGAGAGGLFGGQAGVARFERAAADGYVRRGAGVGAGNRHGDPARPGGGAGARSGGAEPGHPVPVFQGLPRVAGVPGGARALEPGAQAAGAVSAKPDRGGVQRGYPSGGADRAGHPDRPRHRRGDRRNGGGGRQRFDAARVTLGGTGKSSGDPPSEGRPRRDDRRRGEDPRQYPRGRRRQDRRRQRGAERGARPYHCRGHPRQDVGRPQTEEPAPTMDQTVECDYCI